MNPLTRDQAKALTTLLASLRTDWDHAGIMAALGKTRSMGNAMEASLAALQAAATTTNRTPAIIAMHGPHWDAPGATPTVGPGKEPRCTVYGHEFQAARTCTHCRTEHLTTGTWPADTAHQDAPRADPEPYTDARLAASGDHR